MYTRPFERVNFPFQKLDFKRILKGHHCTVHFVEVMFRFVLTAVPGIKIIRYLPANLQIDGARCIYCAV